MSLLGACSRKKQWRQLLLLRALSGQSTEAFHRERVWLKRQVSPVKICLIRVSLFRLTVENEVFNHPLQVFFVFFPNRSLLVMLLEEIIELSTSHLLKTNEKHEQICNVWKVSSILILTNYLWFFSDINNHLLHFQRFLQKYFNWASVKMPYFFFFLDLQVKEMIANIPVSVSSPVTAILYLLPAFPRQTVPFRVFSLTEMLPQPTARLCVQFTIRGIDITMTSLASWCQQYGLLSPRHGAMSQGLCCLSLEKEFSWARVEQEYSSLKMDSH